LKNRDSKLKRVRKENSNATVTRKGEKQIYTPAKGIKAGVERIFKKRRRLGK